MGQFKINMPEEVKYIINQLTNHGYEGFIVGGCVRDALLKRNPYDWDITTNAFPKEIKRIFNSTIDTGIKHGTVTVIMNNTHYEVTTYRTDGIYKDGRRPEKVEFVDSLIEDLGRRDFTMNAMAYNEERGLVDPFEGLIDIKRKVVRCVGNSQDRFNEDALRILRAVRFAVQLNFQFDSETKEAILKLGHNIKLVAMERIRDEINKIVTSDNPYGFLLIYELGLLDEIIPELVEAFKTDQNVKYHLYNVGVHSLKAMTYIENRLDLRLAMLLHDIGKPSTKTVDESGTDHFYGHSKVSADKAKEILIRMRYDKATISRIECLIKYHNAKIIENRKSIKRYFNKIGSENFLDLLKVKRADNQAKNPKYFENSFERLNTIETMAKDILKSKECFNKSNLAISGKELIELGFKPGKEMGVLLDEILDNVIKEPKMNNREDLIKFVSNTLESTKNKENQA